MATWEGISKTSASFTGLSKTRAAGLVTEDLLSWLTTEDDKILLVEPVAGGFEWQGLTKN